MYKKNNYLVLKRQSDKWDPNAPKFIYKRNAYGFTRKSSRLVSGDNPSLRDVSMPSTKKSGNNLYPWTKPMQGYDRIFVGRGRFISKGRQAKSTKPEYFFKTKKPMKRKFIRYPRTYGYGLDKEIEER